MKKNYKTSQEGIEARKAQKLKEFHRRQKLKQNLSKLLKKEGYSEDTLVKEETAVPKPKKVKETLVDTTDDTIEVSREELEMQRKQKRRETKQIYLKKTKKGQPNLNSQINVLLDKIKNKA